MTSGPEQLFIDNKPSLEAFIDLFIKWNRAFGFSKFKTCDEIKTSLIIPSLAIASLPLSERISNILDLGSGPGIPGLPIAIARPDLKITLLESGGKQIEFMSLCIRELGLNNCNILNGRAEKLAHVKGLRKSFDLVLARSFAPVPIVVEVGSAFLKSDGIIMIQTTAEIALSIKGKIKDRDIAGCNLTKHLAVTRQFDTDVILDFMVFSKISDTPENLPRSWNAMKSKPLF